MPDNQTMNLEQQLQILQDNSSVHGVAPIVIEQAVAPVLKTYASQLKHLEYYLLQNLSQGWVLTTLRSRTQKSSEKKVIYAFSTAQDATTFAGTDDPEIVALPIPVIQIIFQVFAIQLLDSVIFLENPGNLSTGVEVHRADVHNLVQKQLQNLTKRTSNLPTDLA